MNYIYEYIIFFIIHAIWLQCNQWLNKNYTILNVKNYYAVIIFLRMMQHYRVDEDNFKHFAASLVSWFYALFTIP